MFFYRFSLIIFKMDGQDFVLNRPRNARNAYLHIRIPHYYVMHGSICPTRNLRLSPLIRRRFSASQFSENRSFSSSSHHRLRIQETMAARLLRRKALSNLSATSSSPFSKSSFSVQRLVSSLTIFKRIKIRDSFKQSIMHEFSRVSAIRIYFFV